jgi:diguanylate cyclase (GGDEF)-like protein
MPHTARGGSAQDSVGVSDAHITPPSSALFRWLADPGKDLPAPIRAALMAELFASPKAVLAALAAGLLLNAAALLLYPGAIFLVLLVLNVLVVALRMGVVVGCTRAMARGQATSTDLYLLTGVLSCCMLGATICVAIWIGGPPLQILAATTALGIIGPICARNYAAPRLAMLQICALDLPLLAGCALAGDLWPVALPMLAVQTPALLFGCLAVIRRFHAVSVAALQGQHESQHLASHDSLTGLSNRTGLAEGLARLGAMREVMAVFCLDLDGFKQVNDRLGHQAGDRLLQAVAARLAATTRRTDILARLGGDEFIIVVPDMRAAEAARFAELLIRRVMEKAYALDDGPPVPIGVSVGVACAPEDGAVLAELHRRADAALYAAKAAGKGGWRRAGAPAPSPGPLAQEAAYPRELAPARTQEVVHRRDDVAGQAKVVLFPRR